MTVIATGLSSARKAVIQPSLSVVHQGQQHPAMPVMRTGSDNLPILNNVAQPGPALQAQQPQQHSYAGLSTPSVWRSARAGQREGG